MGNNNQQRVGEGGGSYDIPATSMREPLNFETNENTEKGGERGGGLNYFRSEWMNFPLVIQWFTH